MPYEVWMIWETSVGWCGENFTRHFDDQYRGMMDAYRKADRWVVNWYSFEGQNKTFVVVTTDEGCRWEDALEFVEMILEGRYQRVYVDLRTV